MLTILLYTELNTDVNFDKFLDNLKFFVQQEFFYLFIIRSRLS